MLREPIVLVLGDHGILLSELSERIRRFGYRALRAKTPQDAIDLGSERGYRFDAVLVEAGLAAADLGRALATLHERAGAAGMTLIATGAEPDADERERLREAGVHDALWLPVGDHALRFHLNRATARENTNYRASVRVPTEWQTRVMVAGRPKPASVYSLSTGGAFLATERPSMKGTELAVELPLGGGRVSLLGRVLYTNVPGNLSRSQLPIGMAVGFLRTPAAERGALDAGVAELAARYAV